MTDAFVIESGGHTAGIAVREGKRFQFYASDKLFWALESRKFRDLRQVHATVEGLIFEQARRNAARNGAKPRAPQEQA